MMDAEENTKSNHGLTLDVCACVGVGLYMTFDKAKSLMASCLFLSFLSVSFSLSVACHSHLSVQADHAEQDPAGAGGLWGGKWPTAMTADRENESVLLAKAY